MIAKVIVDNKSKSLDRPFDYLVPSELESEIRVGSRLLVPFGRNDKELEGYCMALCGESGAKELKSVIRLAHDIPAFDADMLEVIEWMHEKYLAPYLDIIRAVVPAGTALKSREWIILENEKDEQSDIRKSRETSARLCAKCSRTARSAASTARRLTCATSRFDAQGLLLKRTTRCAKLKDL